MEDTAKFMVQMGEAIYSEMENIESIVYLSGNTFRVTLGEGKQYLISLSPDRGGKSLREFGKSRRLNFIVKNGPEVM